MRANANALQYSESVAIPSTWCVKCPCHKDQAVDTDGNVALSDDLDPTRGFQGSLPNVQTEYVCELSGLDWMLTMCRIRVERKRGRGKCYSKHSGHHSGHTSMMRMLYQG